MWISGCGLMTAAAFTSASSWSRLASFLSFQKTSPSLLTAMVMFSGLVWVGMLTALGRSTFTVLLMTGMVMRKMMSSTSMTSTSGVVLMFDMTLCSSEDPPTDIAMAYDSLRDGAQALGARGRPATGRRALTHFSEEALAAAGRAPPMAAAPLSMR